MAAFFSFLGDRGAFPPQGAGDHRLASFVGALGSDQLISGPVFDSGRIEDLREILMLIGLEMEGLQTIRRADGGARRFGWIGFDPILSINPGVVFALAEPVAREFLLDLKGAVAMTMAASPNARGGCMMEVILADGA
jgi:hypothetical protein